MIICGASAYSRDWDYARIGKVADEVGAFVLADIAHPAGLIAKGLLTLLLSIAILLPLLHIKPYVDHVAVLF